MRTPKGVSERRQSARIAESLPFKIGHEGYEIAATTLNISAHGALCVVDRVIPTMTRLKVALTLSASAKEKVIHATGVVVRNESEPDSGKYTIAVYFSDMTSADQKILNQHIQRRLKLKGRPLEPRR